MDAKEIGLEDLPFEILDYIFDFLNVKDRCAISFVSDKFNAVTEHKFLQDAILVFNKDCFQYGLLPCRDVTRSYHKFEFNNCTIDESIMHMLDEMKNGMLSLSFCQCKFQEDLDMKLLELLRSLSISACLQSPDFTPSGNVTLFYLRTLSLSSVHLDYDVLVNLCCQVPNLRDLSVRQCVLKGDVTLGAQQSSKLPRTLTSLDFSLSDVDPLLLLALSKASGASLKELSLARDIPSHPDFVIPYETTPKPVKVKEEHLLELFGHLSCLDELVFKGYPLSDTLLAEIFQIQTLKKLTLCRCKGFTSTGFQRALQDCCCSLVELDVSYCGIDDSVVAKLFKEFRKANNGI